MFVRRAQIELTLNIFMSPLKRMKERPALHAINHERGRVGNELFSSYDGRRVKQTSLT